MPALPRGVRATSGVGPGGVREFTSDSGVRCGVCVPSASARESGAGGEDGCAGNGKAGTSGSFATFPVESMSAPWPMVPSPAGVKGPSAAYRSEGSWVCSGDAMLASAMRAAASGRSAAGASFPLKTAPSRENRVCRAWSTCLSLSFSDSRPRSFSWHFVTSSVSSPVFCLCFCWIWLSICFPFTQSSSTFSATLRSTSWRTTSRIASMIAWRLQLAPNWLSFSSTLWSAAAFTSFAVSACTTALFTARSGCSRPGGVGKAMLLVGEDATACAMVRTCASCDGEVEGGSSSGGVQ
mmetsp:Transcript_28438/g.80333  ORF Transcript_28438/g.80333 Transcript_28438/m.80333 type:complete len:295 (+) Transcript_28438:785-1669(+)